MVLNGLSIMQASFHWRQGVAEARCDWLWTGCGGDDSGIS